MKLVFASPLVLAMCAAFAQAPISANPWVGSWKIDPKASHFTANTKSHYHDELPKSETLKITSATSISMAYERFGIAADGESYSIRYVSSGDGKAAPFFHGKQQLGMASYTDLGEGRFKGSGTMIGGETWTANIGLSSDGRSLTMEIHAKLADGTTSDLLKVYRR